MASWKLGITECRNKGQTKERVVAETEKMLEDDRETLEGKRLEKKTSSGRTSLSLTREEDILPAATMRPRITTW